MFKKLKELKDDFDFWYDEFLWKNSEDRRLLAKNRLKAHREAMEKGKNSPYTHPEQYGDFF